jgi:hypothetical protein
MGHHQHHHPSPPLPPDNDGPSRSMSMTMSEEERDGMARMGQFENDGKHSLLQFALKYFRQKDKFQPGVTDKDDQSSWTWREQVSCVKYSPKMVQQSLLPLPTEQLNKLALECFDSILKYMGDYPDHSHAKEKKHKNNDSPPPAPLLTEVEAVYTLLRVRESVSKAYWNFCLIFLIFLAELPLGYNKSTLEFITFRLISRFRVTPTANNGSPLLRPGG